jgi:hypothetical protein
VPATRLESVTDEWSELDQYLARQAYIAAYGAESMPKFFSDRVDFDSAVFHPTYLNDWSTMQLK